MAQAVISKHQNSNTFLEKLPFSDRMSRDEVAPLAQSLDSLRIEANSDGVGNTIKLPAAVPGTPSTDGHEGNASPLEKASQIPEADNNKAASNTELKTKHPLQCSWTWWHDNPGRKTTINSWASHLRTIYTFNTVEDFWSLYNNIKPASELQSGSDYHLFRNNIEPKWEDETNKNGGKWIVQFPPKYADLDEKWLWTVLACIGEVLDSNTDQICGAVVSVRKASSKIAIWTREAWNKDACLMIGKNLKKALELPPDMTINYVYHSDALKGKAENRYIL
ncbi:uncharacterized protein LOC126319935 [Schistocerca gregaria]|uniref:uncharacterized protein LOC126319935 n=1 Tax=Schistocerca gregaria TaxID=7010 RepID=UPI00211EEE7A|nr:uncharacterized protein LOC126319935 [Schistocerca gregaria]